MKATQTHLVSYTAPYASLRPCKSICFSTSGKKQCLAASKFCINRDDILVHNRWTG